MHNFFFLIQLPLLRVCLFFFFLNQKCSLSVPISCRLDQGKNILISLSWQGCGQMRSLIYCFPKYKLVKTTLENDSARVSKFLRYAFLGTQKFHFQRNVCTVTLGMTTIATAAGRALCTAARERISQRQDRSFSHQESR